MRGTSFLVIFAPVARNRGDRFGNIEAVASIQPDCHQGGRRYQLRRRGTLATV